MGFAKTYLTFTGNRSWEYLITTFSIKGDSIKSMINLNVEFQRSCAIDVIADLGLWLVPWSLVIFLLGSPIRRFWCRPLCNNPRNHVTKNGTESRFHTLVQNVVHSLKWSMLSITMYAYTSMCRYGRWRSFHDIRVLGVNLTCPLCESELCANIFRSAVLFHTFTFLHAWGVWLWLDRGSLLHV